MIAKLLIGLLLSQLCVATTVAAEGLGSRLDAALRARALRGAEVGVLVVRERDGAVLYARQPDRALIPASNMKVLTAVAALDTFGPSHQFETVVLAERAPDASGAVGDLAVRGGGDPVVNSEDWWRLAADLRRSGLRTVGGDLIVDDSVFDGEYWHPDWGRVSSRAYHAPVGGLTANYGSYFVRVAPGKRAGAPVRVDVDPPIAYLEISNLAKTGAGTARQTLSVSRGPGRAGRERVLVRGTVRAGDDPDLFPRSVADPALYAGSVFRAQLEANGIAVAGEVRRGSAAAYRHELIGFEGRPLSEIVRLFMKYSNNSIAESLVKSLGARATGGAGGWESGLAAMRSRLEGLGLAGGQIRIVDGSGLSPANRLTPRVLVDALRMAHRSFGFGPELIASLPIAHKDGTLEKRTRGASGQVRAKTGLLSDQRTTSLSGFARRPDGEWLVFAILVNGYAGGSRAGMDAVDRFAAELVREPSRGAAAPAQERSESGGP